MVGRLGFVGELETSLNRSGVGAQESNLYTVLGFASTADGRDGTGHLLDVDGDVQYPASKVAGVLERLNTDGRREDGYCAIQKALDAIRPSRRASAALHVILVTDEDRDITCTQSNFTSTRDLLLQDKANFVALIKQRYVGAGMASLFGIRYNGQGFVEDQLTPRGYRRSVMCKIVKNHF